MHAVGCGRRKNQSIRQKLNPTEVIYENQKAFGKCEKSDRTLFDGRVAHCHGNAQLRAQRQDSSEEFSLLEAILTSDTSTEELIASANEKKLELIDVIERELVLEGLVKAQGFEDAVVTMSEDNINVVVSQSELTNEQVSGILSVILQETDYTATQVVVVPYTEE